MRTNLKRHNCDNILSSKHTYRPMRAHVLSRVFYKVSFRMNLILYKDFPYTFIIYC